MLLNAGADPNRLTSLGSPIYFTATGLPVDISILKLLVDHGADLKATGREGRTIVTQAADNANWPAVVLLLRSGATSPGPALAQQIELYRREHPNSEGTSEAIEYLRR